MSRLPQAILVALSLAVYLCMGAQAEMPSSCPNLDDADRLILVLARSTDSPNAMVRRFERDEHKGWKAIDAARPAVLGKNGMAWAWSHKQYAEGGRIKAEGDRRTPAGFFMLGKPFGFAADEGGGQVRLEAGEHYCVDDPASALYNTVVPKAMAGPAHGEDMAAVAIYRRGLFIDYPTSREAKGGSCIFVHVWRASTSGTAGCIAMAEKDVETLQHWSRPHTTAIAILTEDALPRFQSCLPDVDRAAQAKPQKRQE